MIMKTLSNLLFFVAVIATFISIVLLDLSMRYFRKGDGAKSKERGRLGLKFLLWAGLFYLISYVIGIMAG